MKKISLIVPAYNEQESLPLLYDKVKEQFAVLPNYDWEVWIINDGSKDNTLQVLYQLQEQDNHVHFVDLSRNFGKEKAMLAGLDAVTGDCCIIMDADLQHPVSVIPQMIEQWEMGADDVYAQRITRGKESWLRKRLSLMFYNIQQRLSDVEILPNVGDFRLLDRKCIDVLCQMRESERYMKGLFCWIGFRKVSVPFETQERVAGTSTWNFRGLLRLAIEGIISFSVKPLRIATILGLLVSLVAFIYACFVVVKTIIFGELVAGYPTLMVVILLLGGGQLFTIGLLGEYLGRVFNETKKRPTYVIREKK